MFKMLKLSTYNYPERVSSSHLSSDLGRAYREAGIMIENYVPTPSRGISKEVREKYKNIKYEERNNGQIIIHRFSMFPEGKNPVLRAVRYLLINIKQYILSSKAEGIDLIYSTSTPPTQGLLCGRVKRRLSMRYGHNVPYLFCLQDVFPDSLVNAKMTKRGSLIWKLGRKIEDYTYSSADMIIAISNDIKNNIMAKGVPEEKIAVIPNWINIETNKPVPRGDNKLFDEFTLDRSKFYVTYAGNLGKAQSVDTILDAAQLLQERDDIQFVLFGGGVEKNEIEERIRNMKNVRLFPLMPQERVSEVYSLGDVSVVACKKGTGKGAIPSKTVSIMATATPIMLCFDKDSELWRLIEENDCGFLSDAENPEELMRNIVTAKEHPEIVEQKGNNALELVKRDYTSERGINAYLALMYRLVQAERKQ